MKIGGMSDLTIPECDPPANWRETVRSKDIGTRAETAVVRLALELGYNEAERLALAGADDRGDIRLLRDPLVILEVKAGKAAQHASWSQIQAWLADTQRERDNAWRALSESERHRDFYGFLVTQRKGYGIGRVEDWCIWTLGDDPLGRAKDLHNFPPSMMPLGAFLTFMRSEW